MLMLTSPERLPPNPHQLKTTCSTVLYPFWHNSFQTKGTKYIWFGHKTLLKPRSCLASEWCRLGNMCD